MALFKTPLYRSMLCPSPAPIKMYDSDGTLRAIARLSNMQLQAFDFKEPTFSTPIRCEQVSFGSGVAHSLRNVRSDSLTFSIGLMTVAIAVLTVGGYAIFQTHFAKRYTYRTMT
ncbi:hypothetical protein GZH46_01394 [Fragariocoptes setiger]|nr:hypothetical protein GZH46_01394 [Fragariocoptes setiger]